MNATDLTRIQRGDRLYSISSKYRYLKWHPTALFSHILREAIINLSNNPDVTTISNTAAAAFMSAAIQPGLDVVGFNPYPLAQDLCATIRTVLEYLSRQPILSLHKPHDTDIAGVGPWSFLSPMDDTGCFHRYVFVDTISTDTIYHHSRSWETWADMCIAPAGLWLHLIAIGSTRDTRRSSPWCRCYASPTIAKLYKFKRKTGELTANWRATYYADSTSKSPAQAASWVDLMLTEDVISPLVYNVCLPEPSHAHRTAFLTRDLPALTERITLASSSDPFALPMCRTSCDTPYPCPHEHVCYSTNPPPSVSLLESSGSYAKLPARRLVPKQLVQLVPKQLVSPGG